MWNSGFVLVEDSNDEAESTLPSTTENGIYVELLKGRKVSLKKKYKSQRRADAPSGSELTQRAPGSSGTPSNILHRSGRKLPQSALDAMALLAECQGALGDRPIEAYTVHRTELPLLTHTDVSLSQCFEAAWEEERVAPSTRTSTGGPHSKVPPSRQSNMASSNQIKAIPSVEPALETDPWSLDSLFASPTRTSTTKGNAASSPRRKRHREIHPVQEREIPSATEPSVEPLAADSSSFFKTSRNSTGNLSAPTKDAVGSLSTEQWESIIRKCSGPSVAFTEGGSSPFERCHTDTVPFPDYDSERIRRSGLTGGAHSPVVGGSPASPSALSAA
jgi:hypothetical protein